jgi:hypothetical protein
LEVSIKEEMNYFGRLKSLSVDGTYRSPQNTQLFSQITVFNFDSKSDSDSFLKYFLCLIGLSCYCTCIVPSSTLCFIMLLSPSYCVWLLALKGR